jgi:hypothetical protein
MVVGRQAYKGRNKGVSQEGQGGVAAVDDSQEKCRGCV